MPSTPSLLSSARSTDLSSSAETSASPLSSVSTVSVITVNISGSMSSPPVVSVSVVTDETSTMPCKVSSSVRIISRRDSPRLSDTDARSRAGTSLISVAITRSVFS